MASSSRPSRRLAVVTCMDTRIDPLAVLGLSVGEAHVLRNAGARVTDDVLRSLALSTHVLGVESVTLMQHTQCGLSGTSNAELGQATGADLEFLPIADHSAALQEDIDRLAATPYLGLVKEITGLLLDIETGQTGQLVSWIRPS